MEWQPISSAPKDGSRFLINSNWLDKDDKPLGVEVTHWSDMGWVSCEKIPTHWMPLPPPPEASPRSSLDQCSQAPCSAGLPTYEPES